MGTEHRGEKGVIQDDALAGGRQETESLRKEEVGKGQFLEAGGKECEFRGEQAGMGADSHAVLDLVCRDLENSVRLR